MRRSQWIPPSFLNERLGMTQQLLAPAGLHDEIIEVYREGGERPANELLAMLNTPGRIQRRGFPATIEHMLAIIISTWRINDDSRFIVYDFERKRISGNEVYASYDQAFDSAIAAIGDDCIVVRFQI